MASRGQLAWTQRNRSRADKHAATLRSLVSDFVNDLKENDWESARDLAQYVSPYVDRAFRAHCRVVGIEKNSLVVSVDQAGLVAAVRTRWLRPLWAHLRQGINGRRIERIVFRYGNMGAKIPQPSGA